jgi:hypothetical protein
VSVLAAAAVLLVPLAACGKKGPPLAPLRPVPAGVTDIASRRLGDEMQIHFTLPTRNATDQSPVDLGSVDVYAVTLGPGAPLPAPRDLMTRKYLVKTIEVRPPPEPEDETVEQPAAQKPPPPPAPPDPRPGPGEPVTFVEPLTAAVLAPAILAKPVVPVKGGPPIVPPAIDPPVTMRMYVVRGRSRGGHPGAPARISLPLVPAPEPPSGLRAVVEEASLRLEWTPPEAAIDPVEAAQNAQAWASVLAPPPPPPKPQRPDPSEPPVDPAALVPLARLPGQQLAATVLLAAPPRFNVYAVKEGRAEPKPLNATPLTTSLFAVGAPVWDQETCFVVRTVRSYGVTIESPGAETCVTPKDTFAPAAPAGLRVVAVPGAMNLIWDANKEADLAGYLVLRGEEASETLQALTPAPIRETSYEDKTVKPGVRYVYAIVAADRATPPNVSAQSPRQSEVAR